MFYDEFIKLCNSISKSPTSVAKEMGFAGAHVTKWKNGSTPTDATIFKICDYFNLPHDYFSGGKKEKSPSKIGEGKHHIPDKETLKLLELLETREDIRYLAAASERATPEHVKATAKMFDELYGRNQDK